LPLLALDPLLWLAQSKPEKRIESENANRIKTNNTYTFSFYEHRDRATIKGDDQRQFSCAAVVGIMDF
jgi:hypothetical protein